MEDLTFGEQVKIILSRKDMTIKELAERIGETTGKKMSRQNLTQRLKRDNFQEQDMRIIAAILGCPFQLSIFPVESETGEKAEPMEELLLKYVKHPRVQPKRKKAELEDGVYQQVLVFDEDTPKEVAAEEKKVETAEASVPAREEQAAVSDVASEEQAAESGRFLEEQAAASDTLPDHTEEELLDLEILDPEDSEDLDEMELPDSPYGIDRFEKADASDSRFKTRRFDKNEILAAAEKAENKETISNMEEAAVEKVSSAAEERDMTIGELYMIHKELDELEEAIRPRQDMNMEEPVTEPEPIEELIEEPVMETRTEPEEEPEPEDFEPVIRYEDAEENLELGEMNPYTGREYQTNSVRMHPSRIGYVQVYDRFQHGWTDMTEWAFLGYQERKKTLLGRDYEPPIYLD